jgi:ferrous iron transport protein B
VNSSQKSDFERIALVGNPNVGKSVVFSRLTGTKVIVSNYPGSTVDFAEGRTRVRGRQMRITDAPGTYSIKASNRAEEVAVRILEEADVLVNVVDATNLERNLFLTLELLEAGKPTAIVLNMWDEAQHLGITIDTEKLEELLGVPVIPTVALTGEGIKELTDRLDEARMPETAKSTTDEEKWVRIGSVVRNVQTMRHRHHTIRDRIAEATIKPLTGIPIAIGLLLAAFTIVRFIGEGLITFVLEPLFQKVYGPLIVWLNGAMGDGFVREILIGKLIITDGEIDYLQAMGVLTTAVYVPFAAVLPYIVSFYLVLSILEDTGYLPRLATLMDNLLHRLGLHGHAIVPVCLGLGCNVAGVLAIRTLETKRQRFIGATLMSISVPCMAQSAMIFVLLRDYGMVYIVIVYLTLFLLHVGAGAIMSALVKGSSPEIFLEIPPYRMPSARTIAKKTWMRVRWFLKDAIPWLFLGVIVVNILHATGALDVLADAVGPFMDFWFGLPPESATALLVGFLRKDLAVGMLVPVDAVTTMSPAQLVIAATVLTVYFPCAATFALLLKELGWKDMLKAAGIMVLAALIVGGLLHLLLIPS